MSAPRKPCLDPPYAHRGALTPRLIAQRICLLIILASSWITPADASQKRLLTPDDLLRLEELKEAVLSPDGFDLYLKR